MFRRGFCKAKMRERVFKDFKPCPVKTIERIGTPSDCKVEQRKIDPLCRNYPTQDDTRIDMPGWGGERQEAKISSAFDYLRERVAQFFPFPLVSVKTTGGGPKSHRR